MRNLLLDALHITRPEIDLTDFRSLLLSLNEIELLIFFAQECLYLNQCDDCLQISTQIDTYLSNSEITYLEKDRLLAENVIVYVKYLISTDDYEKAYELADKHRHQMILDRDNSPLFELTFLTGLASYHLHSIDAALSFFQNVFYSAHSIESCYATTIRNYVKQQTTLVLPEYLLSLSDIELIPYAPKEAIDTISFSNGSYDLFSPEVFTIGKMIRSFRTEQNISQAVLCQGLCSKSKLSKIENGTLQPDIFLAEALLQRLGISEREFTFWGNAKEAQLYNLKLRLIKSQHLTENQNKFLLNQFKNNISNEDVILYQFYLLRIFPLENNSSKKLSILFEALNCTLPNFNINYIHKYRLSWNELTILNTIAHEYRNTDPSKCQLYFTKIIDYFQLTSPSILFESHVLCSTIQMYCRSLYSLKHFHQVKELVFSKHHLLLRSSLLRYSYFLFCFCQALGECSELETAKNMGITPVIYKK